MAKTGNNYIAGVAAFIVEEYQDALDDTEGPKEFNNLAISLIEENFPQMTQTEVNMVLDHIYVHYQEIE